MKKITLLFCLLSKILYAQSYIPIPLDNPSLTWTSEGYVSDATCVVYYEFIQFVDGDTLINGVTYTKINNYGLNQITPNCGTSLNVLPIEAVIRQDTVNRIIYALENGSTTESILIDFSQNIGDTVNSILINSTLIAQQPPYIVSNIDSLLINGIPHRRFWFTASNGQLIYDLNFIEGVGATCSILYPFIEFERRMTLKCMTADTTLIYSDGTITCITSVTDPVWKSITFYPNPATNKLRIMNLPEVPLLLRIADASGRILRQLSISKNENEVDISELKSGIYILHCYGNEMIVSTGRFVKL